jgi:hypothetical protein
VADSGLDIGTLSGRIELSDNSAVTVDTLTQRITGLESKFDSFSGRIDTAAKHTSGFRDAVHTAEGGLSNFGDVVERVGERILAYEAIKKVFEFGDKILEGSHQLEILSKQTGINVEELQVLGAATKEFGVDSDLMGRAIFQLSQRIAGGDTSITTALHMMGLSIEQVKGLKGQELFVTIERALGTLQGTMRDTAAADMFGARLGKSMEAASTGIDAAIDRAKEFNHIAGEDAVKAAAELEIEIKRLEDNMVSLGTTMVGPLAEGANKLIETSQRIGVWSTLWRSTIDGMTYAANSINAVHGQTTFLSDAIDLQRKSLEQHKSAAEGSAVAVKQMTEQQAAAQFMTKLTTDTVKELTDWQKKDLDQMHEMGQLNVKNAAAIGVNADQFDYYKKNVEEADKANQKFVEGWTNLNTLGKNYQATLAGVDADIIDSVRFYASMGAKVSDLTGAFPQLSKVQAEAAVVGAKAAETQEKAIDALTAKWNAYFKDKFDLEGNDRDRIVNAAEAEYEATVTALQNAGVEDVKYYQSAWDLRQKDIDKHLDALRKKEDATRAASQSNIESENNEVVMVESLTQAWDAVASGVKATNINVKLLDGSMVSLAEAQKRFDQGSSFTYDLSTQQGLDQYKKMNPGASISWSDKQIMDYAQKGGNLSGLISTGVINPYAHMASFAEGGYGDFGSGTLAMLHGREVITPIDKVGEMGSQTVNFYINGSGEQIYSQVKDRIVNDLKMGRQFSALR